MTGNYKCSNNYIELTLYYTLFCKQPNLFRSKIIKYLRSLYIKKVNNNRTKLHCYYAISQKMPTFVA